MGVCVACKLSYDANVQVKAQYEGCGTFTERMKAVGYGAYVWRLLARVGHIGTLIHM